MPWLRFIPETTNIDFVGWRYYAFAVDGLLVLISIISIAVQGFNLGIDFTGGASVEAKAPYSVDIGALRSHIGGGGLGEVRIQTVSGGQCDRPADSCVLVRAQPKGNMTGEAAIQTIVRQLGPKFTIRSHVFVGPKVSQELFRDGVLATVLAVVFISIYVAIRFEWQYGIGALVATGHDVFVTAGLFSVLQLDFTLNTVAALLLLAGYSINDTVIVFDRIRENRRKYKRMALGDLINLSTNQMLTRTILTSGATAISIVPLLIFGGPALFEFTAAILFGIVVGTFSSTYVAAALLLYLPAVHGPRAGEEAAAPAQ